MPNQNPNSELRARWLKLSPEGSDSLRVMLPPEDRIYTPRHLLGINDPNASKFFVAINQIFLHSLQSPNQTGIPTINTLEPFNNERVTHRRELGIGRNILSRMTPHEALRESLDVMVFLQHPELDETLYDRALENIVVRANAHTARHNLPPIPTYWEQTVRDLFK